MTRDDFPGAEITTAYTRNSIYEVDQSARQIRRRSGLNPPLPNQVRYGADGGWAPYEQISWCDGGLWMGRVGLAGDR